MADSVIRLAILGSTGSIGEQTLDVVRSMPERFRVVALAATVLLSQEAPAQYRGSVFGVQSFFGAVGILDTAVSLRHAANLESELTYEGTDEVHQLVLGRKLTGLDAFRGE